MDNEKIKELAGDLYNYVFQVLDNEIDVDGATAGKIATSVEDVFLSELIKEFK